MFLRSLVTAALVLLGCGNPQTDSPVPHPAAEDVGDAPEGRDPVDEADPAETSEAAGPLQIDAETVAAARAEFEPVDGVGGWKLYSRADFLPVGDPLAVSDEDFFARLEALFGAPTGPRTYSLRHRETGIVVRAYSGPSGIVPRTT